jgi:RNA polymerase sigma factor (sigma-70 family)
MLKGLLSLLHPDEQQAAVEYRKLHERLVRFFDWNNVEDSLALADEAIDRLAKRAGEAGIERGVRNASSFALGVARHLLQEEARRRQQEMELSRHLKEEARAATLHWESRPMEDALQECLLRMPRDRRELIKAYYTYGGGEKAKAHQELAERLGLSLNSLRNRALRARQELETCIRKSQREGRP